MYRKSPKGWAKHWDFILVDEVAIALSFFLAYWARNGWGEPFRAESYRILFFVALISNVAVAILFNTFSGALKHRRYRLLGDTLRHAALVLLLNISFTFATQTGDAYSRIVVFLMPVFHVVLGFAFRVLYRRFWLKHHARQPLFLITTDDQAEAIIDRVRRDTAGMYQIAGAAILDRDAEGESILGVPVQAGAENLVPFLTRSSVAEVLYSVPWQQREEDQVFASLMEMGMTVHVDLGQLNTFNEQKHDVESIGGRVVLTTAINTISGAEMLLKRCMDILGGLVGSLVALIIMACVAIPIKRRSPGPLLYTSDRIGLNGRHFRMYKIRSMYLDADDRKAELMAQNRVRDGMMFKLDWDPRIIGNETLPDGSHKTGIGEFIRKTSLDEFPQFFNVLKGDMSLVGTRPPTPDEWAKYEAHHRARMATKPGITGMWQISGRSEITDFEEVVRLDMEYIYRWNLGLDIKILLKTIASVLTRKGAM